MRSANLYCRVPVTVLLALCALMAASLKARATDEKGAKVPMKSEEVAPFDGTNRNVVLPWTGVEPWKYKNIDPWVGYPDDKKPKASEPWGATVMRLGRPTDKLAENVKFYRDGLGFPIIMGFELHDGFKGAMFGIGELFGQHPEMVHLELTTEYEGSPGAAPTDDNNMVFYIQDWDKIKQISDRLIKLGFQPMTKSRNPWWDAWCSISFPDPDGWNVVLHPKKSDLDHSEYHYMENFDGPMGRCPPYLAEVMKLAVEHPMARKEH